MTDFEKYLKTHKQDISDYPINSEIWENIRGNVKKSRVINYRKIYIATSAVAAGLLLFFLFPRKPESIQFPEHLVLQYGFNNSNLDEYVETKIKKIESTLIPMQEYDNLQTLYSQVKFLDLTFSPKIESIKNYGLDDRTVNEVLEYYQKKCQVLDRMLSEMERLENNEHKFKVQSEKRYFKI